MIKLSVIIACRNELYIYNVISSLLVDNDSSSFEIIIVDDDSFPAVNIGNMSILYPNVRVIRNIPQRGVGYCFDIGVREAKGETVVLMGGDVLPKDYTWYEKSLQYTKSYNDSIGCSCCLSLDPDHIDPYYPANDIKRYGSRLLPFVTTEDLPSDSPILDTKNYIVDCFQGKWFKGVPEEEVTEVPCLMGAFYVTTKQWYLHINGWDMLHRYWGGLEAWISLKTWLYGGKIHVIKLLETGHIFEKKNKNDPDYHSSNGRKDWYWFNKICVSYTLLPQKDADRLLSKIYNSLCKYELYTLPFNKGKYLAKEYWEKIMNVKRTNEVNIIYDFDWFCNKFNIIKNF